jgi:AcrR family transcriptional regulator
VGIRESSFYAHFPSKQAFVDDLMRSTGADAPHELARSLATQALPLEEYVRRRAEGLVALWSHPNAQRLRPWLEAETARSPELRARFNDQILAMIDTVAATLAVYGNRHPRLRRTTPRVLSWSLVAPLAALRASLLAHGASAEHMAEGQAIAHAHVEAWLAAHGVSESSPHVATRAEIEC